MKLRLLALLSASIVYGSSDINITSNQWQFLGMQQNTNLSELDLNSNDIIWNYKNNSWNCFKKDVDLSNICNEITTLNSGDGFWLYSDNSYNLSLEENNLTIQEASLSNGWNMVSPIVNNMDTNDMFSYKNINSIWSYSDNNWLLWIPFENNTNFTTLTKIDKNQGFWIYSNSDIEGSYIYKDIINYDYNSFVTFGDDKGGLKDGNFSTVTKLSTNDIEDIWNIRFKIDDNITTPFNIGIKVVVPSGSIGEIVYENISIEKGVISSPEIIWVKGIKSTGTQINSSEYLEDLKSIIDTTISLDKDILTLNFTTIAQNQTLISQDSFRKVGDYNITILSDKLEIVGSVKSNYGEMINSEFNNSNRLKGSLLIK
ncbi:MAG: hypothetical protein U9Q30_04110 [Campylobacterota bacterium]|nr:hypothetical protein [Campylobacterota bacterium]